MVNKKCRCVKGIDGFTWGNIYTVRFSGRVWWAVNDYGVEVCGSNESFEPIDDDNDTATLDDLF